MLCTRCSALDWDRMFPTQWGMRERCAHHDTVKDLVDAAHAGCNLCNLVCQESQQRGTPVEEIIYHGAIYCSIPDRGFQSEGIAAITFSQNPNRGDIVHLNVTLGIFAEAGDPITGRLIRGRPVEEEPDSEICFDMVKRWIRDCLENHPACPHDPTAELPTRVIDVGPPDGSQNPFIHLSGGHAGTWVALSYCWGMFGRTLTTTVQTLDERRKGLNWGEIPHTIQDAIKITRALGCRYLWVDSLCVLQKDVDDWGREASRMGDVYKNAIVTIAADASLNADGGIFYSSKRDRLFSRSVSMPCVSRDRGISGTAFLRPEFLDREELNCPLDRRAWTAQEDIVAPRTIHFGVQQLYWDCQTRTVSEGDEFPTLEFLDLWRNKKRRFLVPPDATSLEYSAEDRRYLDTLWRWYRIVCDFVQRDITFPSDRFPAITGLAKEVHRLTGHTYKAGLWLEDFHKGLLWATAGCGKISQTSVNAPSWSWAAVQSERSFYDPYHPYQYDMKMYRRLKEFDADIIDVSVVTVRDDPYGQLVSGTLTIRGKWLQANSWVDKPKPYVCTAQDQHFISVIRLKDVAPTPILPGQAIWSLDCDGELGDTEISYLQIGKWEDEPPYEEDSILFALILAPATGESDKVFRRIGVAQIPEIDEMSVRGWDIRTVTII